MGTTERSVAPNPRPRVLAVDDTPANLLALEAALGASCEVIQARSGPEAIAILRRDPDFDVILMDLQMPLLSGYEATEHIKKMPSCADIPIIFISAVYTEDPEIKRGYRAGAVDYFTKPFDPDILRMKVNVYAAFRQRIAMFKERERQASESEELLRAGRKLTSVQRDLPVGVMIADAESRISLTNEEVPRILESRATGADAYREALACWEHTAKAIAGGSSLARALEAGDASHNEEITVACLDGTTKNLVQSTSPLRRPDGKIVGAVIIIQDVAAHRSLEVEFEHRLTKLVALAVDNKQRAAVDTGRPSGT